MSCPSHRVERPLGIKQKSSPHPALYEKPACMRSLREITATPPHKDKPVSTSSSHDPGVKESIVCVPPCRRGCRDDSSHICNKTQATFSTVYHSNACTRSTRERTKIKSHKRKPESTSSLLVSGVRTSVVCTYVGMYAFLDVALSNRSTLTHCHCVFMILNTGLLRVKGAGGVSAPRRGCGGGPG